MKNGLYPIYDIEVKIKCIFLEFCAFLELSTAVKF